MSQNIKKIDYIDYIDNNSFEYNKRYLSNLIIRHRLKVTIIFVASVLVLITALAYYFFWYKKNQNNIISDVENAQKEFHSSLREYYSLVFSNVNSAGSISDDDFKKKTKALESAIQKFNTSNIFEKMTDEQKELLSSEESNCYFDGNDLKIISKDDIFKELASNLHSGLKSLASELASFSHDNQNFSNRRASEHLNLNSNHQIFSELLLDPNIESLCSGVRRF